MEWLLEQVVQRAMKARLQKAIVWLWDAAAIVRVSWLPGSIWNYMTAEMLKWLELQGLMVSPIH